MKFTLTLVSLAIASQSFANILPKDSSQYYYDRAMAEKFANRNLIASKLFEKALEFSKANANIYAEAAGNLMEMHTPDKAKAYYTKAYELDPKNPKVIKELTTLYYDFRQWDKAIEFANKCNSCENADRIMGMSLYKKEDYVGAEKYLLKVIAKEPNDAIANYTLAKNYIDAEQDRKALPYFEKASSLSPEKPNWTLELATLYADLGNYRAAVPKYEAAIKLGVAQNNDFNENYGYALIYSAQFDKGEEKILEIYKKKGNKEILRELANTLYKLKQFDRCLDYCQKLMEADPKDGKALYQAGLSFIKLGKKDKGQSMCDKAIEIDPSLASKKTTIGDGGGGIGAL